MRIAVASGKGGTGKTTVAAAMAQALGECTFLDLDVEAPNAYIFIKPEILGRETARIMTPEVDESKCIACAECSRVCRFNAIAALGTVVVVFPELCHGCGACEMICEPGAISAGFREIGVMEWGKAGGIDFYNARLRVSEPMSPPLIRALKEKPESWKETVILDCPPGTTCPMLEAVRGSDFCVLVTEPTPFGLHDLEMAADALAELGIPSGVVVNRAGLGDARVHEFCRERGLEVMLEIPNDRRIAELYASGSGLLESVPEMADSMKKLVRKISGRRAA